MLKDVQTVQECSYRCGGDKANSESGKERKQLDFSGKGKREQIVWKHLPLSSSKSVSVKSVS